MLKPSESNKMVGAIMVLYKPDWNITSKAIEKLSPQVDLLCIVDNTPDTDHSSRLSECTNIHYIPIYENKGIAAAQNIGIKYLIDQGFDFIVFSDQDSIIPKETIVKLYDASISLLSKGFKIAAVGTRAYNRQTGNPYPQKSLEFNNFSIKPDKGPCLNITECYSLISSVSLIPTSSLLSIGGFDESLFIDGVDHEWCWRAWHMSQLRSFIVEEATIDHMLGDGDKSLGGRQLSISSPIRIYYQYRNFIWLWRRKTTPKFWKRRNLKKFIVKSLYFPLFVRPRMSYFHNIARGLRDGLSLKSKGSWPNFQKKKE